MPHPRPTLRWTLLALILFPALIASAEPQNATAPPAAPCRVVSLAPSLTEIVYALGRGDLLVGATAYSDHPEAAKRLPRVGTYARPDLERIVALDPDLCLGLKKMTPENVVARLRDMGIAVALCQADGLAAVLRSIEDVGTLLHAKKRAKAAADGLRRAIEAAKRDRPPGPGPRVLYQIGDAPMYAACAGTFIDEIITAAGGENACSDLTGFPLLSRERAVACAPDVILLPSMGDASLEAARDHWADWPEIPAVRDGCVFTLDSDLFDRPGPRLAQGLKRLSEIFRTAARRRERAER